MSSKSGINEVHRRVAGSSHRMNLKMSSWESQLSAKWPPLGWILRNVVQSPNSCTNNQWKYTILTKAPKLNASKSIQNVWCWGQKTFKRESTISLQEGIISDIFYNIHVAEKKIIAVKSVISSFPLTANPDQRSDICHTFGTEFGRKKCN